MSQRFPPEVHAFIRDHVKGRTAKELAELTNAAYGTDFTPKSMKSYKANHKLNSETLRGKPKGSYSALFPQEIAEYIFRNHKGIGPTEMTGILHQKFGTEYKQTQVAAFYKNHRLDSGLTGRYEKGNVPPNKGKTGICYSGSEKGHFQKGHRPYNTTPIGTIRKKSDGFYWEKMGEGARDWKQLHILLWERDGREIPQGHVLIFKDGDKENCVLENLMLITRAENAVMNRCGLRFSTPEHTETGNLIAKIKIAQRKKLRRST